MKDELLDLPAVSEEEPIAKPRSDEGSIVSRGIEIFPGAASLLDGKTARLRYLPAYGQSGLELEVFDPEAENFARIMLFRTNTHRKAVALAGLLGMKPALDLGGREKKYEWLKDCPQVIFYVGQNYGPREDELLKELSAWLRMSGISTATIDKPNRVVPLEVRVYLKGNLELGASTREKMTELIDSLIEKYAVS